MIYKTQELFDLGWTIAEPLLEKCEYPHEALPKIGSFIKPYVKYQIPISAITDITIGPCIKNSDHIKSIVRMIEKKLGPKVDIKYSSIPYRG